MTGHSEIFPWPSYYGHYQFFEMAMNQHGKVIRCIAEGDGVYKISRTQGDELRIFICECYAFGIAQYIESVQQLGHLDAIIINSAWCGYSHQVKAHCIDNNVGVFKIREFMGALHQNDYWNYVPVEK